MGKRSNFERRERDFYPTPLAAVKPLSNHLRVPTWFVEPCAGEGHLIAHLRSFGHLCIGAYDVVSRVNPHRHINPGDATQWFMWSAWADATFITNPPWDRKILHPIIQNGIRHGDCWLLFDADWMHTQQSAEYMAYCNTILSVGRVKWIEGSKSVGKDNVCWYHFCNEQVQTHFVGRGA